MLRVLSPSIDQVPTARSDRDLASVKLLKSECQVRTMLRLIVSSASLALCSQPVVAQSQYPMQAAQPRVSSPNLPSSADQSQRAVVEGTPKSPVASAGPVSAWSITSRAPVFNATATIAVKAASMPDARATAAYAECVDDVGGVRSFCEAGRFQSTITGGINASGYGVICQSGTQTHGPTFPAYLIGCEGAIDNQSGPGAPTYASFDHDRFSASFLATNGSGTGKRYAVDAAFAINDHSLGVFQTGLLITSAVANTGIAATSGTSLANGIDIHLAKIDFSALSIPNDTPIRACSAECASLVNILALDRFNNLMVGAEVPGNTVIAATAVFVKGLSVGDGTASIDAEGTIAAESIALTGKRYAELPLCVLQTQGMIAYVIDVKADITEWRQIVSAGEGTNRAIVTCNGMGWRAIG